MFKKFDKRKLLAVICGGILLAGYLGGFLKILLDDANVDLNPIHCMAVGWTSTKGRMWILFSLSLIHIYFYEWNLSTGSGTYRIQSVSATEGDLSFVTEFSNMYQNLPEEGLLVQKITVTEVVIENIHAAGEESQVAEENENPIDEMNVLQEKGQEEEAEGILENQAQEVNIVDAVKQKNPFILLGIGAVSYTHLQMERRLLVHLMLLGQLKMRQHLRVKLSL